MTIRYNNILYYLIFLLVVFLLPFNFSSLNNKLFVYTNSRFLVKQLDNYSYCIELKKDFRHIINYNALIPDTTIVNSKKLILPISNHSLKNIPSSSKFYAPSFSTPLAFTFALENENNYNYFTILLNKHKLDVASIFIDPNDLFGFTNGLFVHGIDNLTKIDKKNSRPWWNDMANWQRKGKSNAKKIYFQFMQPNNNLMYESYGEMRISGNATRGFSQKSLRLKFKNKKINTKAFDNSFFDFNYILRNGGNDANHILFSDQFIQSLIHELDIDCQNQKPILLYINGIYWGIYSLCEKIDEVLLAKKYNVKKKNVTIIEGNKLIHGDSSCRNKLLSSLNYCKKLLNNDSVFHYLKNIIDIKNFILYSGIQIYAANIDWPGDNFIYFKTPNTKWRFILKDMDCAYSYGGSNMLNYDMFKHIFNKNDVYSLIFSLLMKSSEFKKELKDQLLSLLNNQFNSTNQILKFNQYYNTFKPEIQNHIDRWRKPYSCNEWNNYISEYKNFIHYRKKYIMRDIDKYLNDAN